MKSCGGAEPTWSRPRRGRTAYAKIQGMPTSINVIARSRTPRSSASGSTTMTSRRRRSMHLRPLVEAQQLEQRLQVAQLLAGGRGGAADEVEDLAVLQAVIGKPADLAVLVEIDRDHALVANLLVHEGDRTLGALRDVVEDFAVEGGDGGGCAHHDQGLVLARADRDLLQRAGRQDVALLELLAGAGGKHGAGQRHGGCAAPTR